MTKQSTNKTLWISLFITTITTTVSWTIIWTIVYGIMFLSALASSGSNQKSPFPLMLISVVNENVLFIAGLLIAPIISGIIAFFLSNKSFKQALRFAFYSILIIVIELFVTNYLANR